MKRLHFISNEKISLLIIFFCIGFFPMDIVAGVQVQELIARKGLPNFFSKIYQSDSIRVAYLGGSITAQPGWRVYSLEWMKEKFPQSEFIEINAAIGGTGSGFGVFRVKDHVLKYKPDLVFIEFAVNDEKTATDNIIRSMEGIVRQIWEDNPYTDICFVYTLTTLFLEIEKDDKLPHSVSTMEKIADYYGIPTINFGKEVTSRVQNGHLIFTNKEKKEVEGTMVFSPDGVHPYVETGHTIYQGVLKRSVELMETTCKEQVFKHSLGKPIASDNYSNPHMVDFTKGKLSSNWEIINVNDHDIFKSFSNYFQILGKTSKTGETLTVRFKGRTIGAFDIQGPAAGRLIVEIDGEVQKSVSRFDQWCTYWRMSYFLIGQLDNKEHVAVFRLLSDPFDKAAILNRGGLIMKDPNEYKENNWYIGKIILDGVLLD